MISDPTVTILMATYNGERYLKDQIDSLVKQTYTNWELLIRDDGSTDHTIKIIDEYRADYPNISLISANKNEGSLRNFSELIRLAVDKPYVMFCDQDDYWLPDKIQLSIKRFREEERKSRKKTPLLLYTNLSYADHLLNLLGKEIRSPIPDKKIFNRLMIQNKLWGCTMLMNNPVIKLVQDIPDDAENHDYWVALSACAFGKIIHFDQSTILYRQHEKNISGQYNYSTFFNRLNRILKNEVILNDIVKKYRQMKAFKAKYESRLDWPTKELINGFIGCFENRGFSKLPFLIKNEVFRRTLFSSILYCYYLIRTVHPSKTYSNY